MSLNKVGDSVTGRMKSARRGPLLSLRRKQLPCVHLGKAIEKNGVVISVRCDCNGKEREIRHQVHECAIKKRCLPTFRPTLEMKKKFADADGIVSDVQIYPWCHGCTERQESGEENHVS